MDNPSLRLVQILQQEFQQLHESSSAPFSSSTKQVELNMKMATQGMKPPYPQEGQKSTQDQDTPFKSFRLNKLNEWLGPDVSLHSLNPILDNHSIILETILLEKINDVWLVFQEEWVQDAPLRPFTRGLLQNYLKTYSHLKPSQTSTSHPLYKEQTKKAKELNRLILEDIFPEILERKDDLELTTLYKAMLEKNQKALALSGGGIRSGTFALGIVQGLAQLDINPKTFTYLSTVSGGGFLGGWLTTWIHQSGIDKVFQQLKPESAYPLEPAPIRHLRNYSNYLSPLIGLFSADTWTLVAIYLRNLIVNWLLIIPFLSAIAVIPWIFVSLLHYRPEAWGVIGIVSLGMILYLFSDFFTKKNPPILQDQYQTDKQAQVWEKSWQSRNQNQFILLCLLPALLAVFCWTLGWFWFFYGDFPDTDGFILHHFYQFHNQIRTEWTHKFSFCTYLKFSGITVSFVLIEWIVFFLMEKIGWIPERFHTKKINRLKELIGLLLAGTLAGVLLISIAHMMPRWLNDEVPILYTCLALPTFLCLLLLNGFLYEGIKGKIAEDAEREWMSRYSSWFLLVSMVWLTSIGLILCGPLYGPLLSKYFFNYVITLGAVTSYLTAYLGQKLRSNGKPETSDGKRQSPLGYVSLPLLAFIALAILLIALSFMNIALIGKALDFVQYTEENLKVTEIYDLPLGYPFLILIIMGSLCGIFSYLIKINDFSLHALYRNRLIRAYLGASRPEGVRRADPFTGFDESDNIYMRDLVKKETPAIVPKPFLLINIALNLVSGKNLAWEERKAASFTVSALHAGSQLIGYRKTYQDHQVQPTKGEKASHYGGKRGISLGTAMTISGAAVSPNMGYHTSPLVAFFMTLFNLRLGWWLGNPGPAGDKTFSLSSPKWGLKPLLSEMFGQTDELNNYVYLSDGGHFDNLGLYEMTLRRNRFIIVSDGTCDENCELEDLGNAIRKIRIDQGISIDFPLGFDLYARKETNRKDGKYWAIGRIRYPEYTNNQTSTNYFEPTDGILLYIKPGIYGNEPKDIFNYASSNTTFPHESTGDQFFSESQFESYRALGVHALIQTNQQLQKLYGLSLLEILHETENSGKWKSKVIDKLNLGYRKMNLKPRSGPSCFFGQKKSFN